MPSTDGIFRLADRAEKCSRRFLINLPIWESYIIYVHSVIIGYCRLTILSIAGSALYRQSHPALLHQSHQGQVPNRSTHESWTRMAVSMPR